MEIFKGGVDLCRNYRVSAFGKTAGLPHLEPYMAIGILCDLIG